jgi:hypothetical protein
MKNILVLFLLSLALHFGAWGKVPIRFDPDTTFRGHTPFSKVSILDQRLNKEYVGSLSSGPKWSKIVTTYPFDSMMRNFADKYFSAATSKGDRELVIAFHALNLEEKSNGSYRIGNLYLHADFYSCKDEQYVPLLKLDTLLEFQIGRWDVYDLANVYNRVFSNILNNLSMAEAADAKAYDWKQLIEGEGAHRKKYPVYYEQPRKGIYYTKEQFLQNTPGDTAFIQQHFNNTQVIWDKFFLKEEGKKRGKNLYDTTCFAIFNGEKWFRPYENREFVEMLVRNGEFYYLKKSEGLVLFSNNVGFALGGGIIGYLIAESVIDKINKDTDRKGDAVFRYKLGADVPDVRVERME